MNAGTLHNRVIKEKRKLVNRRDMGYVFEMLVGPHKLMKLCVTDGEQRVFAMEYKNIKDLTLDTPPGIKVVL